MEDDHGSICKFNQLGFCKFREHCRKKHENTICEKASECTEEKCIKRHPKICKNYIKDNNCRFNNKCAYHHKENENNQEQMNEQFKLAILKHERDIQELNEEVNKMKNMIHTMTLELVKCTQNHVATVETDAENINIADINLMSSEPLFQCDQCDYTCGKDITLKKHIDTKHKNTNHPKGDQNSSVSTQGKSSTINCDECDHSCKTKKGLKKHKTQDHQSQNIKFENCGKVFSKKEDLGIHMKENHPKCQCTAVDVCDDCLEEWQDK